MLACGPRWDSCRYEKNMSLKKYLIWLPLKLFIFGCLLSAIAMLYLRAHNPPTTSFIMLHEKRNQEQALHQWVSFEQISPELAILVMASEDQLFPKHSGFDIEQIKKAFNSNQNGSKVRGASTITQQTVKNLFLWPKKSLIRKGIEAWLTIWMELIIPKKRILEIYLNVAQFGKNVFGAQAASQHFYGIDASELNIGHAALLTAALPTPNKSNPAEPSEYLINRAFELIKTEHKLNGAEWLIQIQDSD